MGRGSRHRLGPGIYEDCSGISVIWRSGGRPVERRFPLDTPLAALKRFRSEQLLVARPPAPTSPAGSLVRDVVQFLRFRRGRPSFKSDRAHLRAWVARFGRRSRWAITSADCAHALADWQLAGYSAREIRHRVRILQQLYRAFDGPRAQTPLDDLDLPARPKLRPTSVPDHVVRDVALELRKHEVCKLLKDSKTRARYLVLATTGQRPAQVKRALPGDVDLERRVWIVRPAKGDAGTILYLNDDMHAAWSLFIAARAWGRYDSRSFAKTLRRCGWPKGVRPYNLRHTIGLTLSELGVDLGDIQAHMGHSSPATTRQFYVPAIAERQRAASAKIDGRLPRAALVVPRASATIARGTERQMAENSSKTRETARQEKRPSPRSKAAKTA